jgi:hypothetical protein
MKILKADIQLGTGQRRSDSGLRCLQMRVSPSCVSRIRLSPTDSQPAQIDRPQAPPPLCRCASALGKQNGFGGSSSPWASWLCLTRLCLAGHSLQAWAQSCLLALKTLTLWSPGGIPLAMILWYETVLGL